MELISLEQDHINIDELLSQIHFFSQLSFKRKRQIKKEIEFIRINREEILMHEGDEPDFLYMVYSGRLIVYKEIEGGERVLGVIGQGELIGEMALFSNLPRSASIRAVRNSILLRISNEKLRKLIADDADLILKMFFLTSERMQKMVAKETLGSMQSKIQLIALLPSGGHKLNEEFLKLFKANLAKYEKYCFYNEDTFKNLANSGKEAQTVEHLRVLTQLEHEYPLIILTCDSEINDWSLFCLQHADCFLFIAEDNKSNLNKIEQYISENKNNFTSVSKQLILLQDKNTVHPTSTASFMQRRVIEDIHHVQLARPETILRMIRILLNRSFGLVLSGGGLFGLAHLGVIQALEENKIPIDAIGGVSSGSVIAALYARTLNIEETKEKFYTLLKKAKRKKFFLWQIPLASLIKPTAVRKLAYEIFDDIDIEDLWIPFFSLACSLTTTKDVIFDKGSLMDGVIASNSLPGMLSPLLLNGELFIDGGVSNTMPADIMKEKFGGTIMAVDVSQKRNIEIDKVHKNFPTTFEIMTNKLNPFKSYPKVPYIPEILTRSIIVGNKRKLAEVKTMVDFLVEPDFSNLGRINYKKVNHLIDIGYKETIKHIDSFLAKIQDKI